MPGLKDSALILSEHLSDFSRIRAAVAAADAAVTDVAVQAALLNLAHSSLAVSNTLVLYGARTAGAGSLAATLYGSYTGLPAGTWVNVGTVTLDGSGMSITKNLMAGSYAVVITDVATGTWDLYAAATDLPI